MTNKLQRYNSCVLALNSVGPLAYELVLERENFDFRAGMEIILHGKDQSQDRTYSIASGESEKALRILFRLIPEGLLTPKLVRLKAGDRVAWSGPTGSFLIREPARPIIFMATGTGIAPAASFVSSRPELNYTILHGVREAADLFYRDLFSSCKYHPCISREDPGPWFKGRITGCLPTLTLPSHAHYYLCGANAMIIEVRKQLKQRGVEDSRIFSEPYYFW